MLNEADSRALTQSIGEHSVLYFGKENLKNLAVSFNRASEHADIHVATRNGTSEERDDIYAKYISDILPLFGDEATFTLYFYTPDSTVFADIEDNVKSKSYVMA